MTRGLALAFVLARHPGAAAADGIMLVQTGAVWMGSDSDDPNEAPLHRLYVRDFWIDRHKVTNTEFVRFLNARGAGAGCFARRVVRGESHGDLVEALRVTPRRFYEHRGVARGHHVIGFRCATSEDLGEVAK